MKSPRIYTYKVTFEEVPYWYWGAHKEKRFGEFYLGSPVTHRWMWEFYTPHLQVLEVFPYTDEGWEEARNVEDRCILPDLNNPLCLNEHVKGLMSLESHRKGGVKAAEKLHKERDEFGRSVHAIKFNKKMHEEKDDSGRSVHAVKIATKSHAVTHAEKDELGRSSHAVKMGKEAAKRVNAQKWKCLVTGKISPPGPLSRWQRKRGIDVKLRTRVA